MGKSKKSFRTLSGIYSQLTHHTFKFPYEIEHKFQKSVIFLHVASLVILGGGNGIGMIIGDVVLNYLLYPEALDDFGIILTIVANVFVSVIILLLLPLILSVIRKLKCFRWKWLTAIGNFYKNSPVIVNTLVHVTGITLGSFAAIRRYYDRSNTRNLLALEVYLLMYPGVSFIGPFVLFLVCFISSILTDTNFFKKIWTTESVILSYQQRLKTIESILDLSFGFLAFFACALIYRVVLRTSSFSTFILQCKEKELVKEKERNEILLNSILPEIVREEFETVKMRVHKRVTFVFIKVSNFPSITKNISPLKSVMIINECFEIMDDLLAKNSFSMRLKTIGNKYMLLSGLWEEDNRNSVVCLEDTLSSLVELKNVAKVRSTYNFNFSVGVNYGNCFSGILGAEEYQLVYDIYGDAVNVASRMCDSSEKDSIHLLQEVFDLLDLSKFEKMTIEKKTKHIKGKGEMSTVMIKMNTINDNDILEITENEKNLSESDDSGTLETTSLSRSLYSSSIKPMGEDYSVIAFVREILLGNLRSEYSDETLRYVNKYKNKYKSSTMAFKKIEENIPVDNLKLSYFTLLFNNKSVNKLYNSEEYKKSISYNRILFCIMSCLFLLYSLIDIIQYFRGFFLNIPLWALFLVRYFIGIPVLFGLNLLILSPFFKMKYFRDIISILSLFTFSILCTAILFIKNWYIKEFTDYFSNNFLFFEIRKVFLFISVWGNVSFHVKFILFVLVYLMYVSIPIGFHQFYFVVVDDVFLNVNFLFGILLSYLYTISKKRSFMADIQSSSKREKLFKERKRCRNLLQANFPRFILDKKTDIIMSNSIIGEYYVDVAIMYSDIVGFTEYSSQIDVNDLMNLMNEVFLIFDKTALSFDITRIKVIGDCFHMITGMHEIQKIKTEMFVEENRHYYRLIRFCQQVMKELTESKFNVKFRTGVHYGEIQAGLIGANNKYQFDVFSRGDDEFANFLEQTGVEMEIQVSFEMARMIEKKFSCRKREEMLVYDGKKVQTYFVNN